MPAPIRISMPVMGTSGGGVDGSAGCAKTILPCRANINSTTNFILRVDFMNLFFVNLKVFNSI